MRGEGILVIYGSVGIITITWLRGGINIKDLKGGKGKCDKIVMRWIGDEEISPGWYVFNLTVNCDFCPEVEFTRRFNICVSGDNFRCIRRSTKK
ncbi:MAG: hypothetical protein GF368_02635 [Candidatus Aenigmarchaeota archaeon]|nr:hypothetical protein [Candidatus Aenigmarchaeota archaeon]